MRRFCVLAWILTMVCVTVVLTPPVDATTHGFHARVSFRVTVWNERGFPAMSPARYRHDLDSLRSGFARLPSLAYLGAEFDAGLNMPYARVYARTHGLVVRDGWAQSGRHVDTVEFFHPRPGVLFGATSSRVFHARAAGPHSPARRYVATSAWIDGYPILFVALHLTNGCFGHTADRWWHPARCVALAEEIRWVRHNLVAPAHAGGWTVIVGGDMNTSRLIRWGARQASIRPRTYMQLAVVPAAGVRAHIGHLRVLARNSWRGLFTDHATLSARITLS